MVALFYLMVLIALLVVNILAIRHVILTERKRSNTCIPVDEAHRVFVPIRNRLRLHSKTNEQKELIAVIVEPRQHRNLIPVIKNVMKKIPDVYVYHGSENRDMLRAAFGDTIHYIELPVANLTHVEYNCLMTLPEFYEIIPAEFLLIFQTDSCLFEKSTVNIRDFFKYDYVGAPWIRGGVGNGGLSLRRRQKMIEVLKEFEFLPRYANEDVYLYDIFRQGNGKLPPDNVAAKAFFEMIESEELPFGAHKKIPEKHRKLISKDELAILSSY
uniref:DUF5672 domain-containing protein n=1 Tax=viral metagenome TaxID=1070528 RepID=A0A6C0CKQ5_9ZZZZ